MNFKMECENLRKSSLFFLTKVNSTEMNQSEKWNLLAL